jgi:3-deoxy-D-manno-octulosonate 8-phosphate phosphatase (KDO 8-P phosphatase)
LISDDIDEHQILKKAGMPITVADGMSENRKISAYVTRRKGGEGAVREAIETFFACIKTIKKD